MDFKPLLWMFKRHFHGEPIRNGQFCCKIFPIFCCAPHSIFLGGNFYMKIIPTHTHGYTHTHIRARATHFKYKYCTCYCKPIVGSYAIICRKKFTNKFAKKNP